jgi:hypothetical protein
MAVLAIGIKRGVRAANLREPGRHSGMAGNAIQRSRVGNVRGARVNGRRASHRYRCQGTFKGLSVVAYGARPCDAGVAERRVGKSRVVLHRACNTGGGAANVTIFAAQRAHRNVGAAR